MLKKSISQLPTSIGWGPAATGRENGEGRKEELYPLYSETNTLTCPTWIGYSQARNARLAID